MNARNSLGMILAAATALCVATDGRAASVTVALPQINGSAKSEVRAPILVRGAQGLGPFQMDLAYDANVLEAKSVVEGGAFAVGLLDFNVLAPGRLRIVMTGDHAKPIEGDGTLLIVNFLVRGAQGQQSPLTAENVRAWEQTPEALDMRVSVEPGQFTVGAPAVPSAPGVPLWVWFTAGGIAIVVILVLIAKTRRRP